MDTAEIEDNLFAIGEPKVRSCYLFLLFWYMPMEISFVGLNTR